VPPGDPAPPDVRLSHSRCPPTNTATASKLHGRLILDEIRRVLRLEGESVIQLPITLGARCLFTTRYDAGFVSLGIEVGYWTISEFKATFSKPIGLARIF
jgi:hypothetical protein